MTLLARLDRCPPKYCRNLALDKSYADLAKATGIPKSTIAGIVSKDSWAGVRVEIASALSKACGVNLLKKNGK